jgi:microsomal dipeptidase-like Zn-dependent dipeptidase
MAAAALVVFLASTRLWAPQLADRIVNRVHIAPPYTVDPQALAVHRASTVVDLHADALIWGRDLLERHDRGQVDVPRLRDGNVFLEVFSMPTRARTGDDRGFDRILANAVLEWWPLATWQSTRARALYLTGALRSVTARSDGLFRIVTSRRTLQDALAARARDGRVVAGLLALEGGHALEGRVETLDTLHAAGVRMLGLIHRFDNDLGGSSTGTPSMGLTPLGLRVVRRAEDLGMVIDLAHASPATFTDVLRVARHPVVVSHTGVRGTCDRSRNLTDEQLRAVAATDGVIGIGFWSGAVCGRTVAHIARAIRHAARVAGIDHVALGSDFDGDATVFDASGLPLLTSELLGQGMSVADLRKVLGENVLRVLASTLPAN